MKTRRRPATKPAVAVSGSGNGKTGPVAVTYSSQVTCPEDCRLRGNGCYAENGPMGWVTARLNAGAKGMTPLEVCEAEADAVRRLPALTPLRLHAVGDAPDDECAKVLAAAAEEYMTRGRDCDVWTYTHAWKSVDRASWGGVSVLASCHSVAEAEDAMARGYAAAVIVESFDGAAWDELGDGGEPVKLVACRFQADETKCIQCKICFRDDRLLDTRTAVAFAAHGARRKSVVKTLL